MPRRQEYGEVVNDHQLAIARRYEELGHLLVAYTEQDLPRKIEQFKSFVPVYRTSNTKAVTNKISEFLNSVSSSV